MLTLGIKAGDEVITTPLSAAATTLAITAVGAKPVFVDINPDTYNIDVGKIKAKITKKTQAILPVHLFGQPAAMSAILKIAKKYKLKVIEDACQAHGAKHQGKIAGTFGEVGCFSFYPSKNLSAFGDGGCLITNNKNLAEKAKILRDYGQKDRFQHQVLGLNSRLDEIQAAILNVKLKYLNRWNSQRRQLAQIYEKLLKDLPLVLPKEQPACFHIYHLYVLCTKRRNQLCKYLKTKGIQTQIHYPLPLYNQPAFRFLKVNRKEFPMVEKITKEILSLPLYPELKETEVKFIAKEIRKFFK